MAKKSGLMTQIQHMLDEREREVRHHTRVFDADMFTIALGRMGFREKKFDELDRVLLEVSKEYSEEIVADSKVDKDLWYAKDRMDREIKQYVGKRFVPYEERYR